MKHFLYMVSKSKVCFRFHSLSLPHKWSNLPGFCCFQKFLFLGLEPRKYLGKKIVRKIKRKNGKGKILEENIKYF